MTVGRLATGPALLEDGVDREAFLLEDPAQPLERIHLDLPDPLAGHAQLVGHLFEGRVLVAVQAESALDDLALLVIQLPQPLVQVS